MMTVRRSDGSIVPPPKPRDGADRPSDAAPAKPDEPPATTLRGPTPDEIIADPLVRTVLDVFEGEVKRIHPRPKKPD